MLQHPCVPCTSDFCFFVPFLSFHDFLLSSFFPLLFCFPLFLGLLVVFGGYLGSVLSIFFFFWGGGVCSLLHFFFVFVMFLFCCPCSPLVVSASLLGLLLVFFGGGGGVRGLFVVLSSLLLLIGFSSRTVDTLRSEDDWDEVAWGTTDDVY